MEADVKSILFQHPCNIFITGPIGCGKTEFVHKLIDYRKDYSTLFLKEWYGVTKNGNRPTVLCRNNLIHNLN